MEYYELAGHLLGNDEGYFNLDGWLWLDENGRPHAQLSFLPTIPNDGSYSYPLFEGGVEIPEFMAGERREGNFVYQGCTCHKMGWEPEELNLPDSDFIEGTKIEREQGC